MRESKCGKGHIYDSDTYASCPYCNGDAFSINFGGGAASIGKTVPGGNYGAITPDFSVPQGSDVPVSRFGADSGTGGAANIGATVPLKPTDGPQSIGATHIVAKEKHGYDPVVGWLVCVEGPHKGKDFRLYAKINSVGRSDKNDVCIEKDNMFSREGQFRVAYEEKRNEFYMISGNSQNTNYLNGEPMYSQTKLAAYDIIESGETKLVFIPLCSERFKWEDSKK